MIFLKNFNIQPIYIGYTTGHVQISSAAAPQDWRLYDRRPSACQSKRTSTCIYTSLTQSQGCIICHYKLYPTIIIYGSYERRFGRIELTFYLLPAVLRYDKPHVMYHIRVPPQCSDMCPECSPHFASRRTDCAVGPRPKEIRFLLNFCSGVLAQKVGRREKDS